MVHYLLAGVRAIRTPDVGLVSASGEPFREMRRLFAAELAEAIFGGKAVRNILIWKSQSKTDNSFLPKVHQSQSLPGRMHFVL